MKMKRLLSLVRQAALEYDMIEDGDSIGVGISGGKDSLTLFTALKQLERFYGKRFEVFGICIDLGFEGTDFGEIERYFAGIGGRLIIKKTDIGRIVFNERKEENPCGLCSRMRKGALYDAVREFGGNKVALGHNRDDAIETFYMSLFYEGRIHTFSPVTDVEGKGIKVIRPLIYTRESDIKGFANKYGLPVVKSMCPADGKTVREDIKEFIRNRRKKFKDFDEKSFGAIKRAKIDCW